MRLSITFVHSGAMWDETMGGNICGNHNRSARPTDISYPGDGCYLGTPPALVAAGCRDSRGASNQNRWFNDASQQTSDSGFRLGPWAAAHHWSKLPIRAMSKGVVFRRVSRATSFDTLRCRLRMPTHGLSRLRQASSTCTGEIHLSGKSLRNDSSPKAA
jgi:hypothetical protein